MRDWNSEESRMQNSSSLLAYALSGGCGGVAGEQNHLVVSWCLVPELCWEWRPDFNLEHFETRNKQKLIKLTPNPAQTKLNSYLDQSN